MSKNHVFLVICFVMSSMREDASQFPCSLMQQRQLVISPVHNIEEYLGQSARRRPRHEVRERSVLPETQTVEEYLDEQEERKKYLEDLKASEQYLEKVDAKQQELQSRRFRRTLPLVQRSLNADGVSPEQDYAARKVFFSQHKSLINKFMKTCRDPQGGAQQGSIQSRHTVQVFLEDVRVCVLFFCFGQNGNRLNLKKSYTDKDLQKWGRLTVSADNQALGEEICVPEAACSAPSLGQAMDLLTIRRKRSR